MMSSSADGHRSAEERAEALMRRVTAQATRVTGEATRVIARVIGRAREEIEDVVADARALNRRDRQTQPSSPRQTASGS
jgi:hypothetical protein